MPHATFTDVVERYYERVDTGNVDDVVALFETDARYLRPGYAELRGRRAIRAFYAQDRIIESGTHVIGSMVGNAGTVAVEGRFSGTVRGGRDADVEFADFFLPGPNGLIQHRRTYFFAALI